MDVDKQYLRHCILFCFRMKKNAAQAAELINSTLGEKTVTHKICKKCFARFRSDNFNLEDDERTEAPVKVMDKKKFKVCSMKIQDKLKKNLLRS